MITVKQIKFQKGQQHFHTDIKTAARKKVLLQKLGSHLAPSDEGAGERSETEGEKKLHFLVALHLLSLRHGKAAPPPSSEGGENC